ncbi:MAG: fructosamine kinase family protein [Cocleimonas sp.]
MNGHWKIIEQHISQTLGKDVHFKQYSSVSGGCINQASKVTDTNNKHWFIKTNKPAKLGMFKAESAGLQALRETQAIRVPESICHDANDELSYLVLEYIELNSTIQQAATGQALAKMHLYQNKSPSTQTQKQFGWLQDNTIGSTPQSNTPHNNWVSFWKEERLLTQLNLAKSKGYSSKDFESGLKLAENLDTFFTSYLPQASLLHGDLWSGNCASDPQGQPVIYDPAVYIGDRETDIAMTELFGGFSQDFYDTYHAVYPLDPDYKTRKQLYNLYHILNHFNLFDGGYGSQAATMTKKLLAEV